MKILQKPKNISIDLFRLLCYQAYQLISSGGGHLLLPLMQYPCPGLGHHDWSARGHCPVILLVLPCYRASSLDQGLFNIWTKNEPILKKQICCPFFTKIKACTKREKMMHLAFGSVRCSHRQKLWKNVYILKAPEYKKDGDKVEKIIIVSGDLKH